MASGCGGSKNLRGKKNIQFISKANESLKDSDAESQPVKESSAASIPSSAKSEERLENVDANSSPSTDAAENTSNPLESTPHRKDSKVLKSFPQGADQLKVICARQKSDLIRDLFCQEEPAKAASLVDLQKLVGLDFTNFSNAGRKNNGKGGNPAFVLTGHSSSLVARFINPINPRAILLTPKEKREKGFPFVAMGFARGEQFVELVTKDFVTDNLRFFLITFKQECNDKEEGCSFGDLLTQKVEENWQQISIYEDEDLKNTVFDCLQCHQPGGPQAKKILRMQELEFPWTHFFTEESKTGKELISTYEKAHPVSESYAGIPGSHIRSSEPFELETLIRDMGFAKDNSFFDTKKIDDERKKSDLPGQTWLKLYEQNVLGQGITIPYFDAKVYDENTLQNLANNYRLVIEGKEPLENLLDIRAAFKNDRHLGFQVKEGLSGRGILVHACRQCHNSQLDQSISRARFNIDLLDEMSDAQKNVAAVRMLLSNDSERKMPPPLFKQLSEREIELAIEELRK